MPPNGFEFLWIGYGFFMTESSASQRGAHTASTRQDVNGSDPTLGALVNQLTTQVPELIRSEIRLAQAEVTEKGKRVGVGIGMFSGAGLMAFFGFGTLLATIILVLSLLMDPWIAALIVTVVLFVIAGVLALLGKNQVQEGTPLAPERAVSGVKEDIATVKGQRA
jgi:uncharacterized membrane protein YqjE